jgi:excisionase family DNA binding protein
MARETTRGQRQTHAISRPRRDPQLDALPPPESLAATLRRMDMALAKLLQQRESEAKREQPNQPRAPPEEDPSVRVHSVREAAQLLRISKTLAYALVKERKIPSIELGKRRVIPHAVLLRLLEAKPPREAAE